MKFIAYNKSTVVWQPREQPFYLPAPTISPQRPTILRFLASLSVRSNHFNAPILFQLGIKLIAVICFAPDKALRQFVGEISVQGCLKPESLHEATRLPRSRRSSASASNMESKTPFFTPSVEPPAAGLVWRIPPRQIFPVCACPENPKNTV